MPIIFSVFFSCIKKLYIVTRIFRLESSGISEGLNVFDVIWKQNLYRSGPVLRFEIVGSMQDSSTR